jgi:hypothetical protein
VDRRSAHAGHHQGAFDPGGDAPEGLPVHAPRVPKAPNRPESPWAWRACGPTGCTAVGALMSCDPARARSMPTRPWFPRHRQGSSQVTVGQTLPRGRPCVRRRGGRSEFTATGNEVHHVVTCVTTVSRSGRPRDVVLLGHGRRRAGSVSARWRAIASGPGAGVALQGAHRGVAGPGEQQRQVGAVLGGVGEGRMAQLMQRPPGTHPKQFGGPPVRQPGLSASRVQVEAGDCAGWPAATQ